MAVVKVIYQSHKGFAREVAMEIADELGIEAIDIDEVHSLGNVDLLFVGVGLYAPRPEASVIDYLDQLPVNTIKGAAVFSTTTIGKNNIELVINALNHKGIAIYPKQLKLKAERHFFSKKQLSEKDLQEARSFAREVMTAFQG